jgi:folate-binding protein YgfZ
VILDAAATARALDDGAVGRVLERDVVWVDGPDARSYLQGQVTQDLEPLAPGGSVEALVLSPQGKIDGYVRIVMVGDERFGLEIERGFGDAVAERIRRFKIRIKATLEQEVVRVVEVRGPLAEPAGTVPAGVVAMPVRFGPLAGYDLFGPSAALPDAVPTGSDEAFEAARITAGVPRMGRELTDKTIPAEAGLVERTVSFTKGCYTGQELVARLDSRGNRVPWNLRSITIDSDDPVAPGAAVTIDGTEVGHVTSAARAPGGDGFVALGYLKRGVEVPTAVAVVTDAGPAPGQATALPADGPVGQDVPR